MPSPGAPDPSASRLTRRSWWPSPAAPTRWRSSTVPPASSPVIRSERLGELTWRSPRLPSGRAGNHGADGWFVASGPGIEAGEAAATHPIVDLLPTLYRWLGLEPDPAFAGQAIPELVR